MRTRAARWSSLALGLLLGATFNRFGLLNVMKQLDGSGTFWVDDAIVDGQLERFDRDPQWDQSGNRRTYTAGQRSGKP